jgi:hypothetical protein
MKHNRMKTSKNESGDTFNKTKELATSFPGSSLLLRKEAGAGHVSHGNLIAQGVVGKVSNYMLPLSHFTLLLQGVSVLYRSTLRIIYTCQI